MLLTVFSPLSALATDDFDEDVGGQYPEDIVDADDISIDDSDVSSEIATYSSGLSLAELRAKFPAGKYWNHAGRPGTSSSVNNQDGWTSTPCPKHKTVGTSAQTCNGFAPDGVTQLSHQCMGYAEKLGYDATGYNPRNNAHGWTTSTSTSALNSLKPGDIVRFQHGANPHSIYITGVDGDTVTYTDCNSDGHCIIRWDVTMNISTLRNNLIHVRSAPFAMSGGASNQLPQFAVDSIDGGLGKVHIHGWAYDPDDTNESVLVHVYIGDEGHTVLANQERSDLDEQQHCGRYHGFSAYLTTEKLGTQDVTFYAIDNQDSDRNTRSDKSYTVNIPQDTTGPTIEDIRITNVSTSGYTISCTVTDANGVDRVQFPTWATSSADLPSGWETSSRYAGSKNGNTYTYRVNTSDYNNASGPYSTHIYAFDHFGNISMQGKNNALSLPTRIVINTSSTTLSQVGQTAKLTATIFPSNATLKNITWSSSNTKVATVSSDGTVKAVGYGTANITAKTDNGKSATAKVIVAQPTLTKLEVATMPGKTFYYIGETLNTNGLTLKATYNDGTTKTINSGFTCTPTVLNTIGNQTITVSYGGLSTSFTVGVHNIILNRIEVATKPAKTEYFVGDTLDTTGLTLKAIYNNGASEKLDSGFSCTPTTLDKAGTQTITVTYNGKTTTFNVNVQTVDLSSLEVVSLPAKTEYSVGDTLDTTGLTLKATYNNGSTKDITTGFTCDPTTLNKTGTQTITVSYDDQTTTFTVTVAKASQKAPTGLLGVAPTSAVTADGKITGTTSAMEWAAKGSSQYTRCTANAVNDLLPGIYLVRYAATTTQNASAPTEVEVPAYVVTFQPITLTFDATDGILDVTDDLAKVVYAGETYGRLPEPTAAGFVFTGWYTSTGTRITALTTCDLTQDTTVYARWEPTSALGYDFNPATGTLTINCTGAMDNYSSAADTPWYNYRSSIRSILVQSGVTSLSSYAFAGCEDLVRVELPGTLRSIGTMAFYDCDNLTELVIPASVSSIASYAFANNDNLTSIVFEGDAPAFGTGVFALDTLDISYPATAPGWDLLVEQHYGFGGSIRWTRNSTALYSDFPADLLLDEPELYDDLLSPDWTL